MINTNSCPVCRRTVRTGFTGVNGFIITVICQVCGSFMVTLPEVLNLQRLDDDVRAKISSFTRIRALFAKPIITLVSQFSTEPTSHNEWIIENIIKLFPQSLDERIFRSLSNLVKMSAKLGEPVEISQFEYPLFYVENSEKPLVQLAMIIQSLIDEGYLQGSTVFPSKFKVTVKGWRKVEEMNMQELMQKRMDVLTKVYEMAHGKPNNYVDTQMVEHQFDPGQAEFHDILEYLRSEQLLFWNGRMAHLYLSQEGVRKVENANLPLPNGTSTTVQNYTYIDGNSGLVQVGTQNSTQNMVINQDQRALTQAVLDLARSVQTHLDDLKLSDDEKDDVVSTINTIEVQASAKRPDTGILKLAGRKLITITQDVATKFAVAEIVAHIGTVLQFLK